MRMVCRYFKEVVDKEPLHRMYFNETVCSSLGFRYGAEEATVTQQVNLPVSTLLRKAGKGSAVVMELRKAFSNAKWFRAWLHLKGKGFGWFEVIGISGI